MLKRLALWVRRLAAVLILLIAIAVGLAGGLLTPYFLAARTANILLLTFSAVGCFALLTWAGTRLALSSWGSERTRLTTALSGLLTIIFFGLPVCWGTAAFGLSFRRSCALRDHEILATTERIVDRLQ